jgi:hypothetical protein
MLRNFHNLERSRSLEKSPKFGENYCAVLFLKHLSEFICKLYGNEDGGYDKVKDLTNAIDLLRRKLEKDMKIEKNLLVECLKKHTLVFNKLKKDKVQPAINEEVKELWTIKCIQTYVSQFKDNIKG